MPSGRRARFAKGTPVLDAARQLGVYIESVCGGRGICGRCQIAAQEGHFAKHGISSTPENLSGVTEAENRYADKRILAPGRRLSCQALVQGDLVVDVPQDVQINRQIVRKRAETRHIERDPATHLCYVEVEEPDMEAPLGDADRLLNALVAEWHLDNPRIEFRLLPLVQKLLREGDWKVTCAVHDDGDGPLVTAIFPGFHNVACGIAVDIGSTTIAAHLSSLLSGRTLASAGAPNPQIRFGEDLMSRVSYVMMNPEGRGAMTKAVREAIGVLIAELVSGAGVTPEDVLEATFVGNPIMHHLFLGIDPTELGGAPFALAVSGAVSMPAREIGLPMNEGARVYVLPCIAGHVGADAAAVTLSEGPHRSDDITLVVDVGTNAEIVLGNKDKLVAASSPTGPAFEGAEISGGQRAAPGAIERVRIDPETLEPKIKVIGGDEWSNEEGFSKVAEDVGVTGICGSGIIEAVGEMYLAGIIDEDGVIDGRLAERSDRVQPTGRTFSYLLWAGDEAKKSQEIKILQTDIRAIQLAKAALYAGVRLLMDELGLEEVEAIKLAGAFGSYIDPKYAMVIGLIPDCRLDKVKGVGNAAGTGARMALLNRGHRREIEEVVRRIEKIETALEPRFQEHFVAAMAFPNKVHAFPHLSKEVTLPARKALAETGEDGRPRRRGGRRGAR
ncbi:ASKHA domain-containing protein [Afifella sp. IM 167]|uniref:ASKHA domain-containing protein n=1 Tax=Afifella sp. IM 167 TaxID=2033586 RepID=UPI001CCE9B7E|nr:ASKHA domain-containing protein [Afifella sp. IM 167]MBZ8133973.1 drug:proton antiporter [Afifella sp. IM 167]